MNDVPVATSSYARQQHDVNAQLQSTVCALTEEVGTLKEVLGIMAAGNPQLTELLRQRGVSGGVPTQQPPPSHSQQDPTFEEEDFSRHNDFLRELNRQDGL